MRHIYRSASQRIACAPPAAKSRRTFWFAALFLIAGLLLLNGAHADTALCGSGSQCARAMTAPSAHRDRQMLDFGPALQFAASGFGRRDTLSSEEYFSFSGVGAIVCTVDGKQRLATAFLVGAFDIAVTVAHTFDDSGAPVSAESCIYTSTDSLGQIRERIPVSYIRSQWDPEAGASGHAAKDFAVVRLHEPSRYAQRTMPLGKFSGNAAPVLMIGFRSDLESDPLKSKSHGTVYERKVNGVSLAPLEGFTHDIDASGIAAGAPVIDERTGVIIGMHTIGSQLTAGRTSARNTMITMNEWLEQTLRAEMQVHDAKGADSKL